MKHLIVIGIGGASRDLQGIAEESLGYGTEWDFKGFLDGDRKAPDWEYELLEKPVLGDVFSYEIEEDDVFICAVGATAVRKRLIEAIAGRGGKFLSVIHKTAFIHEKAKIGDGVLIAPHTFIGADAELADHVTLLSCSSIGHDAKIGIYSSIMGHVSIDGRVRIGQMVYIGDSANVLQDAKIGDEAFVGASSLVLRKVKVGDKVFGVPAVSIL